MLEPDIKSIKEEAGRLGFPCVIPYVKVVKSELRPIDIYANLRKESPYSFLLESAITGEKIARYSFLGANPAEIIRIKDGKLTGKRGTENLKNPIDGLRKILYFNTQQNKLPKFFGGVLGYFSYDMVKYFDEIGEDTIDDLGHEDARLLFVKDLIVFDHWREEILAVSNIVADDDSGLEEKLDIAMKKTEELVKIIAESKKVSPDFNERKLSLKGNFKKEDFLKAVEQAKEYIYAGDIFQGVISQRFETEYKSDPLNIYMVLKEINPSPYMYFLEFEDLKIIGSSPEILVKTDGRKITVRPIAGTRPRGSDIVEDEALAREMVNDEKERAEHVMLVDLGRNDVGKVSKFGTVEVDQFFTVEKYSHVQHIVSNVVGDLQDGLDSFDVFEASFPAGTVTGAPKVRAMQIIEELEPTRRGIYAGSIGYFSFNKDMDMAITIRTIVLDGKKAYIQSGAGIVADSVPEKEYQETINKARGMVRAIELAGG